MDPEIEPEVRDFIDRYIESVEQLEILLLLFESSPKVWSAAEVNERIQSHLKSVKARLQGLCDLQLITCGSDAYNYKNSPHDGIISRLSLAYKQKRIRVIGLIFSKPTDKIRNFSDAFKIRKDPKDG